MFYINCKCCINFISKRRLYINPSPLNVLSNQLYLPSRAGGIVGGGGGVGGSVGASVGFRARIKKS